MGEIFVKVESKSNSPVRIRQIRSKFCFPPVTTGRSTKRTPKKNRPEGRMLYTWNFAYIKNYQKGQMTPNIAMFVNATIVLVKNVTTAYISATSL